jgi:putative membrane-bound dehydrogenase-like protein
LQPAVALPPRDRQNRFVKSHILIALVATFCLADAGLAATGLSAGVARVDITPEEPTRLTGYASRKSEAEGVAQRIWAKAVALADGDGARAVLITVDNCGVCSPIVNELAARLAKKASLARERLAVASSHTHSAPMTRGFAPNIFAADIPADQQQRLDKYSDRLIDQLEGVALAALADLRPAQIEWNEGRVCFAKNRRTDGGPVDHALPVLCVRGPDGNVRAVVANYACHCTTLGGDFNKVHGDWAGCAQEEIERVLPGAVALITIGCGADANPFPRGSVELAQQHGTELAREVAGSLHNRMRPLTTAPRCQLRAFELPMVPPASRAEWEQRSTGDGIIGHLARKKLRLLDSGAALPTALPYTAQTWTFGNDLAMVFLAGEVVVDYSRWLKENYDSERLWISAYANDVPCYIPSKRILAEGGYEAESSLWYYDRASRLAPEAEDKIHDELTAILPAAFKADTVKLERPSPRSPDDSLAAIRVAGGLQVELVAAEPLVLDPIAIDWDARGRLWVLEMGDYPKGIDGNWKPGGLIKCLEDRNVDGKPDHAVTFLENLQFPTGIMCWADGIFVCAAPDILFARDRDGDGRADQIEKRFSGFPTKNYNARVNSLTLGLDHWIYGAGGLLGGVIEPGKVDISGRDFRFHPVTGVFEPASGLTQQGRVRDDWGNWFGCDNSNLLWHYPFAEEYARRNPHVAPPSPLVAVPAGPDPNRLFPTSRTLERFNDFDMANRTTSACGLAIYRDDWLGADFYGNAFTCEAVHNLVRRHVLEADSATFRGHRPADEQLREFLSTRDNWTRFVQARTGPDGALWLVDMYRFVIEHPTWITEERQKTLDLRAGADRGRIFRLRVPGKELRAVRDLTRLDTSALAAAIDSRNGTERDRVHAQLLQRGQADKARPALARLAREADWPATRAHALCVLDGLGALTADDVRGALDDPHPDVRRQAIRLSEKFGLPLDRLATDSAVAVRFQAALATKNTALLARLAVDDFGDKWMRAAILSSAIDRAAEIFPPLLAAPDSAARTELITGLVASSREPQKFLPQLLPANGQPLASWQSATLAQLLGRKSIETNEVAGVLERARAQAVGGDAAALRLAAAAGAEIEWLLSFFGGPLEEPALDEIAKRDEARIAKLLLAGWSERTPLTRTRLMRALIAREAWHPALLEAVKSRKVMPAEVPLADQQQLVKNDSEARGLFPAGPSEAIEKRLATFASAEHTGRASAGRGVFERVCASCHRMDGIGHDVGPDVAPYRGKPAADLLISILAPNAVIEPRFVGYEIRTRDGRLRAGIVRDETASSLTLVQPGGTRDVILRADIERVSAIPVSLMPEGLEQAISPQEMADLWAWFRKGQ